MSLFDFLIRKKDTEYIGIRYQATGVFGYSIREGKTEIFNISSLVLPKPDIYLRGFHKEYVHKHYDGKITLVPGVRRIVIDEAEKIQGYYEYIEINEFRIIAGKTRATVKLSENGWNVFEGEKQVANIRRLPPEERSRFTENGYEMEKFFAVNISQKTTENLYPYIMAIPMLGF